MNLGSGSYKGNVRAKDPRDTRNSWHELTFVAKYRYDVFGKQKTIDACVAGFRETERFGFRFRQMGFALNHVQFSVDVPKRYSLQNAEILLKRLSAQRIFAEVPGFRKRYPRGTFWSGYEHHQSIGKDSRESARYILSQPEHHGIHAPLVQKAVFDFTVVPLTEFV